MKLIDKLKKFVDSKARKKNIDATIEEIREVFKPKPTKGFFTKLKHFIFNSVWNRTPNFDIKSVLMDKLEYAFKIDVFSAGVTLYRMLCNEMPFGLFETWDLKEQGKLAKMKPNFQIVSWIQTQQNNNQSNNNNHQNKIDYIRKLATTTLSKNVLTLLRGMLRIRPHKRLSISECLKSPFFEC